MKKQLPPDLGMRILALVIAVALWFVVASDNNTRSTNLDERVVNVEVNLKGLSERLVALTDPGSVQVRLRVPAGAEIPDDIAAVLNLANLTAGEHNVRVDVTVPPKFSVVQVTPERITMRLDNKISREFAVELALIGFPPGETVSVMTPVPAVVKISGAESRINAVRRVLAMLTYSPALSDQAIPVMVRPIDGDGAEVAGVVVEPNQVTVTFSFGAVNGMDEEGDHSHVQSEEDASGA